MVRATDEDGRSQYRLGTFHTPAEPLAVHEGASRIVVTFHRIHVSYDGDKGANRGELSFRFAAGDPREGKASLGEAKISSGTTVSLDDGDRSPGIAVVTELGDFLPIIRVQAWERDADWKPEFCGAGNGLSMAESDRIAACDIKINTASGPCIVATDQLHDFPSCSAFGLTGQSADSRCLLLQTVEEGGDLPRFEALVSLDPVL